MPHYKCTSYYSQSADDVSPHPILLMLLMGQLTSMVGHERWVANFWQTLGSKERTLAGSQEGGREGILVTYPSHVPRSILLPPSVENLEEVDRPLSQFSFEHVNIVISEQEYSNQRKTWIWKFCDFDRKGGKIYSCPLLPKTIFARIASLTPAGCCSRPAAGKCSSSQALTPDPSPDPW